MMYVCITVKRIFALKITYHEHVCCRYKIATLQGKAPGAAFVTIDPSKEKQNKPSKENHSKVTTIISHEEL